MDGGGGGPGRAVGEEVLVGHGRERPQLLGAPGGGAGPGEATCSPFWGQPGWSQPTVEAGVSGNREVPCPGEKSQP